MGGFGDVGKALGKVGDVFKGGGGLAAIVNPTALIGTAAAVGDTLYGAYANKKEAKKEREWQQYMVDYQNAYNTPAAQMARYAEAGLNPNLIYGQQNYSASTGSVPHANIPALNLRGTVLPALKLGQDLQLGQEQINQVKLNNDVLKYNLQQAKDRGVPVGDNSMLSFLTGDVVKGIAKDTVEAVTEAIANFFNDKPKTIQQKRKEAFDKLPKQYIDVRYTRAGR